MSGYRSILAVCIPLFALLTGVLPLSARGADNPSPDTSAKSLTLAVLDFEAPAGAEFLGPALAQSMISRLCGLENVHLLERRQIKHIIAAQPDASAPLPRILGTDYLLSGRISLMGSWPEPECRVRISCLLLHAETGRVEKDGALVCDGTLGEWFELGDRLALILAERLGRRPASMDIADMWPRDLATESRFGRALLAYDAGQELLRAMQHQQAGEEFGRAAQLAREALGNSTEEFFAAAHTLELHAREARALALEQGGEQEEARAARERTVEQFAQDASEAAAAFFNLGRAHQALGDYRQALAGYRDYLEWANRNARSFSGALTAQRGLYGEDAPGWYDNTRQANLTTDYLVPFILADDRIFYLSETDELVCTASDTGAEFWRVPCPGRSRRCLIVRAEYLYMIGDDRIISVMERASGRLLRQIPVPTADDNSGIWRIFFFPRHNTIMLTAKTRVFGFRFSDPAASELLGSFVAEGPPLKISWLLRPHAYLQFGDSLYINDIYSKMPIRVSAADGALTHLASVPTDPKNNNEGVLNLWPGEDHVLMRIWKNREPDRFVRYYPQDDHAETVEQPLLPSYLLQGKVADAEKYGVPLVDRITGIYRIIPATKILPYTCGRDIVNHAGEIICAAPPLVRLEGEHLWIVARSVVSLFKHTEDFKLLWRKRVEDAGGFTPEGLALCVFTRDRIERHRAVFSLADRMVESAAVQMAECHLATGNRQGAAEALALALHENGSNTAALLMSGQMAAGAGDIGAAVSAFERVLWYAPRSSEEYPAAAGWLRERFGLRACLPGGEVLRYELTDAGVWVLSTTAKGELLRFLPHAESDGEARAVADPGAWCAGAGALWGFAPPQKIEELTGQKIGKAGGLYTLNPRHSAQARLVGEVEKLPGAGARMALLDDENLLCVHEGNVLRAYSATDAKAVWELPMPGLGGAKLHKGLLYLSGAECDAIAAKIGLGKVRIFALAVRPDSGKKVWEKSLTIERTDSRMRETIELGADRGGITLFMGDPHFIHRNRGWLLAAADGKLLAERVLASGCALPSATHGLLSADMVELVDKVGESENVTGAGTWGTHLIVGSHLFAGDGEKPAVHARDLREDDPRRLARLEYLGFLRESASPQMSARLLNERLAGYASGSGGTRGREALDFMRRARWRILDMLPGRDTALKALQERMMRRQPEFSATDLRLMLSYAPGRCAESTLIYPPEPVPVCRTNLSLPYATVDNPAGRLGITNTGAQPGLYLLGAELEPLHPPRLSLAIGEKIVSATAHGDYLCLCNHTGHLYVFQRQELQDFLAAPVARSDGCFASSPQLARCGTLRAGSTGSRAHNPENARQTADISGAVAEFSRVSLNRGDFCGADLAFGQWLAGVTLVAEEARDNCRILVECSDLSELRGQRVVLEVTALKAGENVLPFARPEYARFWRIYCAGADGAVLARAAFTPHVFAAQPAGSAQPADWNFKVISGDGAGTNYSATACALTLARTADRCRIACTGTITVPADGRYELTLWLAGSASLHLGGVELMADNAGGGWRAQRQLLDLRAGAYPVQLNYAQTGRYRGFALSCGAPGGILDE